MNLSSTIAEDTKQRCLTINFLPAPRTKCLPIHNVGFITYAGLNIACTRKWARRFLRIYRQWTTRHELKD
ncbi:hypothetical protein ACROYT_G000967 [Oculina patagonica]